MARITNIPRKNVLTYKYAYDYGVQAAKRKYHSRVKMSLNESTVKLFKKQYTIELEEKCSQEASKLVGSMPPANFLQEKQKFLQEIIDCVKMEDIPPELIFNWDQTGLPTSPWTMARKGSKRIEMKGLNDKR